MTGALLFGSGNYCHSRQPLAQLLMFGALVIRKDLVSPARRGGGIP